MTHGLKNKINYHVVISKNKQKKQDTTMKGPRQREASQPATDPN